MEHAEYIFDVGPIDGEDLLPEVMRALEKRTELLSRERYPGLWKHTDRLNAAAEGRTRSRLRMRITGVACLVLGVFLFVPGLMEPQELLVPLLAGALAICAGIWNLWRSRKKRKNPFEEAAKKLLADKAQVRPGECRVLFSSESMAVKGQGESGEIPYGRFECVIEAADLFLLAFDGRVAVLLKKELSKGSVEGFRGFMAQRVANCQSAV